MLLLVVALSLLQHFTLERSLILEGFICCSKLLDSALLLTHLESKRGRLRHFCVSDGCDLGTLLLQNANQVLLELHLSRVEKTGRGGVGVGLERACAHWV